MSILKLGGGGGRGGANKGSYKYKKNISGRLYI